MVETCGGGSGSGSGSGAGTEPLDERMWGFISSEITCCVLDQISMIFGSVKEGILEIMEERQEVYHSEIVALLDERVRAFRAEITACQLGVRTPLFWEFKAYGAPEFFGAKNPIAS